MAADSPLKTTSVKRLDALLQTAPYDLMNAPVTTSEHAAEQVAAFAPKSCCRSRDRLHLATMDALRVRRLLTNDEAQARAAEQIGFAVVFPR